MTADPPNERPDKGAAGTDGPVARHLNRPLSRQISRRAFSLPLSPDAWSYAAFGLVSAGAAAFAVRAPRLGALLVHAGSVLDGVDGEVARLQGTATAEGALLDLALDRMSDVALVAGLARGAGGGAADLALALAAANGIVTASVVKERAAAEGIRPAELQRVESRGGMAAALLPLGGRDGRLFAVVLLGLARRPRLALWWLTALSTWRLALRLRTARELLRRRD